MQTTDDTCTGCTCGPRRYHVTLADGPRAGLRATAYPVCHAWALRMRRFQMQPARFALVEACCDDCGTSAPLRRLGDRDALDGRHWTDRKSRTVKVRKALGYTYP